MINTETLYAAVDEALNQFLGHRDYDDATVELVADTCREAIAQLPNHAYYGSLLEKSSTYVRTDMNEYDLDTYTDMLEDSLVLYGLV
jgi:hypothetical protein